MPRKTTTAEKSTAQAKKYYTVGVLEKAFEVIDIMSREARWDLARLAAVTGMPKGTLQRILLTLAEHGYVSRNERGQYALTLQLFRLGQRIAANNSLLEQARPHCRRLMQTVNETVNLCVALNTDMVVADQQASPQMLRLDSIIGSSLPIFQSASGKVWCAFLDELDLLRLMQEIRRKNPDIGQAAVDRFLEELPVVRQEGVAFDREDIFRGVRCVSAPIFDCAGKVAAVVSCSVPSVRVTETSSPILVREIAGCAAQISQALGAPARVFSPPAVEALLAPTGD